MCQIPGFALEGTSLRLPYYYESGFEPPDHIKKEYEVDVNIFNIVFDLMEKKFIHESQKEERKKYFDLKSLFNISAYSDAIINASQEEKKIIQDLYEKFTNYEIPIIITKKRALEEVGVIFERVNNTGTTLKISLQLIRLKSN